MIFHCAKYNSRKKKRVSIIPRKKKENVFDKIDRVNRKKYSKYMAKVDASAVNEIIEVAIVKIGCLH